MITPADTPPEAPAQMPGAPSAGPAPVPYQGPAWPLAPGVRAPVPDVSMGLGPAAGVLGSVTGANYVSEAPLAAPNVTPPDSYPPDPVWTGGDADAGGRDDVAGTVAAAVAAAQARFAEHEGDTYGQGSTIGDPMTLPPATTGNFGAAFYDPPREYGEPS